MKKLVRKRGRSAARVSFIADSMLANLCRWLRVLGVSTVYSRDLTGGDKEPSDDELIKAAADSGSVLLTRDETLAQKAANYAKVDLLESDKLKAQLAYICKKYHISFSASVSKSRCPKCNSPVCRVQKKLVRPVVWPKVYAAQHSFWRCIGCGQVYWKGGHWAAIKSKLSGIGK